MANRLAREQSPYLLQHADNPVDWYPWGDDAFARAAADDKPLFLSVGYSTCHWCHVMAHESFEDAAIAQILNRDFVAIKLDREERPDIDRVYMTFVQATTGAGGWPMSVWLTPDRKPFFGGTYFPPSSRWGRPGFAEILGEIARAWREDRPRLVESADAIVARLRETTGADDAAPVEGRIADRRAVDVGVNAFSQAFDARHGGFGGAPKFPRPSELLFLLEASAAGGERRPRQMALDTLHAMALGGMHDHVGGGFHRYSVDAEWRVPHFEKMLYDQAQIVLACLEAFQASGEDFHAAVAEDTLDYVVRDLTASNGAFYSAEDADSRPVTTMPGGEGHDDASREGAFYVWTAAEIDAIAGADAAIVRRRFGVEDHGNAPSDPQGEFGGQNILYVAQSIEDVAVRTSRSVDEVMLALARARRAMFDARARRPRPHRDDKIIAAWNGLMIAAFARAALMLVDSPRRADWLGAAERAAEAAHARLWRADVRRLWRRDRDGAGIDAFCEDYACLAWGALELFQASADARWLTWAREIVEAQIALFWDDRDGGWFSTTGEDPTVMLRLKEDYDGAEPSPASVTVRNLITLAHLTGDAALRDRAARTIARYGSEIGRVARVVPMMLANVALWYAPSVQIAVVGAAGDEGRHMLERASAAAYQPAAVRLTIEPGSERQAALARELPWVGALRVVGGRAAAYVCREFVCQAPVTDPSALAAALEPAPVSRIILP